MAVPTGVVRNAVMGKVEIEVSGFAALTMLYDQGNASLGPLDKYLNERVKTQRRGNHLDEFWGARMYPTFSIAAFLTEFVGSDDTAPGTVAEALFQLGAYDDGGALRPPTCTIRWTVYGSVAGLADDEVFELTDCSARIPSLTEAMEGNSFTIEATVNGEISVTRGGKTITLAEIAAA